MKNRVRLSQCLLPGLGLKRWALLGGSGIGLIIIGLWTLVNNQAAKNFTYAFVDFMQANLPDLTFVQGLICLLVGVVALIYGGTRVILQYSYRTQGNTSFDNYYKKTSLENGPNIVVLGGGTGLSVLLKGLKHYTSNITAGVSVGDDGGSSGRLREEFGVIPVGDIRACIVALADEEDIVEKLFNYRFVHGQGLKGHSLGNLLLLALTVVQGNFQDAVGEVNQIFHMRGRVLPITMEPLVLQATLENGDIITGESNISEADYPIEKIAIKPEDAVVFQPVIEAIREADAILLGPGSLYTSIIPNLCVSGVKEAIKDSGAPVIYVCNVMTQPGETTDYSAGDHLKAILKHSMRGLVDYVLVDDGTTLSDITLAESIMMSSQRVAIDKGFIEEQGAKLAVDAIVERENPYLHDPHRLAKSVWDILYYDNKFRMKRGIIRSFWDYQIFKSGQESRRK